MKMIEYLKHCKNVDALIINSEINTRYLSGYECTNAYFVITKDVAYYLTDDRYFEEAKLVLGELAEVISVDRLNVFPILDELLRKHIISTIGLEDNRLPHNTYMNIAHNLQNYDIVPIGEDFDIIRQVKTDSELAKIRQAAHINDIAFNELLPLIREGITEREVGYELEYRFFQHGANGLAFDTIVAFGDNTSKPHAHKSNRQLKNGELITIDFGCKYDDYCSDITRTFAFGNVDKELVNIYNIVLQANKLGIDAVKAGARACDLDKVARDYIDSMGYGQYFVHGLGHSVGIEVHESPYINRVDSSVLVNNMVITIEPGVYMTNFGGVRIEDLVVVKGEQAEVLSQTNKEFLIL